MYPPEIKETPNVKQSAEDELSKMGAMTLPEKLMASSLLLP